MSSYSLSKGLIADFSFDRSTVTIADGRPAVKDRLGNKGYLIGTREIPGRKAQCLRFDGEKDHIELPGIVDYSNQVTVAAWVIVEGSNAWDNIICGAAADLILTVENNKLNFASQSGWPFAHEVWSETELDDGMWHHVAGTYDGQTVKVYVDGVKESELDIVADFRPGWKCIGSDHTGRGEFFKGCIDELKVYNRALTETEMEDLFKL